MLRVHTSASTSYQKIGMLDELALMALSFNYCDLHLKDTNQGFLRLPAFIALLCVDVVA